ncbi:MAG: S-layer homology domain-containing protein [Nitriliruptor sp.]
MLETGSFSWPGHGQVRAQTQHLRAYADPTVTVANLANPLESPRFHLVSPKGKAPTWERMGSGNWATDPNYGTKILSLYASMRQHARDHGGGGQVSALEAHVIPFRDVPLSNTHAPAIAALLARGDVRGCATTAFCPSSAVTRDQFATLLTRVARLPAGEPTRFHDVDGTLRPGIEAITSEGYVLGCSRVLFCPSATITRGQVATIVQAALDLDDAPAPFPDVTAGPVHSGAIGALAARGLVAGGSDGRFRPNDPVTRGQAATILRSAFLG